MINWIRNFRARLNQEEYMEGYGWAWAQHMVQEKGIYEIEHQVLGETDAFALGVHAACKDIKDRK